MPNSSLEREIMCEKKNLQAICELWGLWGYFSFLCTNKTYSCPTHVRNFFIIEGKESNNFSSVSFVVVSSNYLCDINLW
jgi:hypothetical protein